MMAYGYSVLSEINNGLQICVPSISLFHLKTVRTGLRDIRKLTEMLYGGNDNVFRVKGMKA
jgi:hypothetical protein